MKDHQDLDIDKALDWQARACVYAAIKGMDLKEVHITQELIEKYRGEAKDYILSLITLEVEKAVEEALWNERIGDE